MNHESLTEPAPDWAGLDHDLRNSQDAPRAGTDADLARFALDGVRPARVVFPGSVAQVQRVMESAAARGVAVVPAGFGAHLGLGAPSRRPFLALSLASLNALVDHQPANMTLTAEAGADLHGLQAAVAVAGQWLPVEPPLPDRTSVGGLISADLSGPSRFSQGTVRDLLIGITVVRADGSLAKSGGRVVKNVAGYDLGKLYCGALGTLGVIVEATFKLRTLPEARAVVRIARGDMAGAERLLDRVLTAPLEPSFIELVARLPASVPGCVVMVGLAGAKEDVADQAATLSSLVGGDDRLEELSDEEGGAVVAELRDAPALGEPVLGLKVSVLPARLAAFITALEDEGARNGSTMAVQAHAGNGIIHLRMSPPDDSDVRGWAVAAVDRLRGEATGLGGTLVVERASPDLKPALDLWGVLPEGLELMKSIKRALDPTGVLSPGRFLGGI